MHVMHDPGFSQIENTDSLLKGLFTSSVSVARLHTLKEYIDYNCTIYQASSTALTLAL